MSMDVGPACGVVYATDRSVALPTKRMTKEQVEGGDVPPRVDADYAEVEKLLVAIAHVPRTSAEFALKRSEAITKWLPLADHIAYRFVGRGESSEDLIQVARLGLVNAVDRYNPDKGRFLAF